jgi:hypothetical protein
MIILLVLVSDTFNTIMSYSLNVLLNIMSEMSLCFSSNCVFFQVTHLNLLY